MAEERVVLLKEPKGRKINGAKGQEESRPEKGKNIQINILLQEEQRGERNKRYYTFCFDFARTKYPQKTGISLLARRNKNMSRSLKKGPYVDPILLEKISKLKPGDKTVIKTWSRRSEISPEMVGFTFGVHNGKEFIQVSVSEDMVGHRLGEFSHTRKFVRHGGKMQREIEAKKKAAETQK